jgi:hypothetical protein
MRGGAAHRRQIGRWRRLIAARPIAHRGTPATRRRQALTAQRPRCSAPGGTQGRPGVATTAYRGVEMRLGFAAADEAAHGGCAAPAQFAFAATGARRGAPPGIGRRPAAALEH